MMKFLVLRAADRVSERFELDSIVTTEEAHVLTCDRAITPVADLD
jgi:hypothetical protein